MSQQQLEHYFHQGDIGGLSESQAFEVIELAECLVDGQGDRVAMAIRALGLEETYLNMGEDE